jgi:hypothetical protein
MKILNPAKIFPEMFFLKLSILQFSEDIVFQLGLFRLSRDTTDIGAIQGTQHLLKE